MNRIKELREEAGMNMREAAKKLGLKYSTYVNYEKGFREPNSETLVEIADLYHVSVDFLLGLNLRNDRPRSIVPIPEMKKIPLVGSITCGTPILAKENIDGNVSCPKDIQADFALICMDDSMIGARIHDGDIVYIREQPDVESGEIAAILIDDQEATLKRVRKFPGKIILFPENPEFEPMVLVGEEISELRILGKAVAFTSAIK